MALDLGIYVVHHSSHTRVEFPRRRIGGGQVVVLFLGETQIIGLGVEDVEVALPISNDVLDEAHLLELRELHVLFGMAFEDLEEDFIATITFCAKDNIVFFEIVQEEIASPTTRDNVLPLGRRLVVLVLTVLLVHLSMQWISIGQILYMLVVDAMEYSVAVMLW